MGMNLRAIVRIVICFAVVALALAGSASAQQLATLRVTVADQSGGVIPQARVTVRSLDTDAKRTELATDTGVAVILMLGPMGFV